MMLCSGVFILLVNCEIGMSRDWDALAPFGFVFSVGGAYTWFQETQEPKGRRDLFLALTLVALLQTVFVIFINADETRALHRLDIIQEDPYWSIRARCYVIEEQAIFYRNRNDLEKAALYYNQIASIEPRNLRHLLNLTTMYWKMKDTSKLIETFKLIETQGQANAQVYTNLSNIYAMREQYDIALSYALKSEALDSSSATIASNIGKVYAFNKKDYRSALSYFLKSIKRDSSFTNSYINAAYCYEKMGNHAMAYQFRAYAHVLAQRYKQ